MHDTEIDMKVIAAVRYHPVLSSMSEKTRLLPSVSPVSGHQFRSAGAMETAMEGARSRADVVEPASRMAASLLTFICYI